MAANPDHPAEHKRFVDGLVRAFNLRLSFASCRGGAGNGPFGLRFGLPRSGTTLIEQILASHSRIHGAGELRFARRSFESIPALLGLSGRPRDGAADLDRTTMAQAGRAASGASLAADPRWKDAIGSSTRCRTIISTSGCWLPCFQGQVHPLPARPARYRCLMLDDRLPQHPLGQRSRPHRRASTSIAG